ncbi:MAG: glyoxalase superfamily protein [Chloroflexi bacterium]|nr:glyoxalase superfamily protein [Chloroflexota bacterium]MCL5107847.1 glyoxalase superfamily protein [Chloroflexota bacterium]
MQITHVKIVSLPVADQERAKNWYLDKLGFGLRTDSPLGENQRWVEVAPIGAQTSLALVTWFPNMPPGSVQGLVLATDDIEEAHRLLSARGVQFHGPIETAPWGRYSSFADPDGNGWVLQQDTSFGQSQEVEK